MAKDPIVFEQFISSGPSNFTNISPTVDIYGQPMTGVMYMFYALTINHKPGDTAGTDGIPAVGGDAGFNVLTNIQLRLATPDERTYFLRNGGVNREATLYNFTPETGGDNTIPNVFNKAQLVVSTKPPNTRWDLKGDPRVSFKMINKGNMSIALETVVQGGWYRSIVRYSFTNDLNQFTMLTIDPAEYTNSVEECIAIGRLTAQALGTINIGKFSILPTSDISGFASGNNILFYDIATNSIGSSSSSSIGSSSSSKPYTPTYGASYTDINTSTGSSNTARVSLLDTSGNENYVDASNNIIPYRKILRDKCSRTLFKEPLIFEGTKDPLACKNALNLLKSYNIKFNNFTNLSECTLCTPDDLTGTDISGTNLGNAQNATFTEEQFDASGATYTISGLKLGNGFTYEFNLIDDNEVQDVNAKFLFQPLEIIPGSIGDSNKDINKLQIQINEYASTIIVYDITPSRSKKLLGQIQYPPNFKLYQGLKLKVEINTYPNKSISNPNAKSNILYTNQDITDANKYLLYSTSSKTRDASGSEIIFIYNDSNTIQATFSYNNQTRSVPAGNYTFSFGTNDKYYIVKSQLNIGQFNRILLNVLTGVLTFNNNNTVVSTIQTSFKESSIETPISILIGDTTGTLTYYAGTYTALPNRYVAVASATSASGEVVLIEAPEKGGVDITSAQTICQQLNGTIATIQQLQSALGAGANWCTPGWCSFPNPDTIEHKQYANGFMKFIPNMPIYRAAYPVSTGLSDDKCISQDEAPSIDASGTIIVSTPNTTKAQILCFRAKDAAPTNKIINKKTYIQNYFNYSTGRWKQSDNTSSNREIFALEQTSGPVAKENIPTFIYQTKSIIATIPQIQAELENIRQSNIPLPDIPIVGWAKDASNAYVKIMVLSESVDKFPNTKVGINIVSTPDNNVSAVYCYGDVNQQLDISGVVMRPYNARLSMKTKNDTIEYTSYKLKTQALIDKATTYNIKGALIVKEYQQAGNVEIKTGSGSYVGCDINDTTYGCIPKSIAGKTIATPIAPLVSKTQKFKKMELNPALPTANSIREGISNALTCQKAGGDIAITDTTYPGCPAGECCEPTDPPDNTVLDTSMFADTCDDSNTASASEECDATDELLPQQQSFKPFTLTRVQQTKTPTSAKCKKPTLSSGLKGKITEKFANIPEYMRDVYQIAKNERIFSLRMM